MEAEFKPIGQAVIEYAEGGSKVILIERFKALDCWQIQTDFTEFVKSGDKEFKRNFTVQVLKYAFVMIDDTNRMPFSTYAIVENHLRTPENIKAVFDEILAANGIDIDTQAKKSNYWTNAADEMASSFMAEVFAVYGPVIKSHIASKE